MQFKSHAVGENLPNEACQYVIDTFPDLMMECFRIMLEQMQKRNIINQSNPQTALEPRAAITGVYAGLLRIVSLDGKMDVNKAKEIMDEELQFLMKHSKCGYADEMDVDQAIAEVEASLAKTKNAVN